tara:strand:- start:1358 stop:2113 length:756 start_codon:yes stop_codon:yes gene_type:complete
MKNYIFITAREQSSRLKKKCLKKFGNNNSVLSWVVKRTLSKKNLIPIICTGDKDINTNIIDYAKRNNILYFSGPENNKIKRWYECGRQLNISKFHALDCDDPFFDPQRLIDSLQLLEKESVEIILPSDYSDNGAATEGFSIRTDSLSFTSNLEDTADTEMCYSFFKKNLKTSMIDDPLYAIENIRLTLDYNEDYKFLNYLAKIFQNDVPRSEIETYIQKNYKETPNFSVNRLWKDKQNNKTKETYENFSRA